MDQFLNKKFKNTLNHNFDHFLSFIGVNVIFRKIAVALYPTWYLSDNVDGTYTVVVSSAGFDMPNTFMLGEEFKEKRRDGHVIKTRFYMDGEKLIQTQEDLKTGKKFRHEKLIINDNMISVGTAEGWNGKYIALFELVK